MVGSDKTRTQLSIDKDLKKELEAIAKKEDRSFNNMIVRIIRDFVQNYNKDDKGE